MVFLFFLFLFCFESPFFLIESRYTLGPDPALPFLLSKYFARMLVSVAVGNMKKRFWKFGQEGQESRFQLKHECWEAPF